MTRMQFLTELATAKPNEWVVYHTGNLLYDSQFGEDVPAVKAVAVAAMEAWDETRVHLVQKRVSPGVCAYIAIKRDYDVHLRKDQKIQRHYITERKKR
jgi:hypothetical protein